MTISFNQIPGNAREPFVYIEFDPSKAVEGASLMPYKILVLAQRLATGAVAALTRTRVTSAKQGEFYFGAGSMMAQALAKIFANNEFTEVIAVALDDLNAGVTATGAFKFTGSPTAAGIVELMAGGRKVRIGAAQSATAAAMATAAVAAIAATPDLPFTAAVDGVDTAKINLTARHKGTLGNSIDLRLNYYDGEVLPAGLTVQLTAFSGGTGNPDLLPAFAVLGDEHYQVIAHPYTDPASLMAIETELADRFGPTRQIDGVAFTMLSGTHSACGTLGDTRNSPHSSILGVYGSPSPPWEWAGAYAARVAQRGQIDPARPYRGLPLNGILPPKQEDQFTLAERNLLTFDGISTYTVDDGGIVRISLPITTYKTNQVGADDTSYLHVRTMLTNCYLRWDWRNLMLRKFVDFKLAKDGTAYGAGQAIVTPNVALAESYMWFRRMEELGLVEDFEQFKRDAQAEIDAQNPNRLNMYMPPNLVNGLDVLAVQIGFRN
ncbi:phage tail sheath subtilisin-like domain-containing protein [Ferrovibrio terrae]|uniref:phage tail sheath subtilisin-like domain-containing protein n=1 Tax=Ferrovibrio terrae TaxID=2594003 RepID=UPI0031380219